MNGTELLLLGGAGVLVLSTMGKKKPAVKPSVKQTAQSSVGTSSPSDQGGVGKEVGDALGGILGSLFGKGSKGGSSGGSGGGFSFGGGGSKGGFDSGASQTPQATFAGSGGTGFSSDFNNWYNSGGDDFKLTPEGSAPAPSNLQQWYNSGADDFVLTGKPKAEDDFGVGVLGPSYDASNSFDLNLNRDKNDNVSSPFNLGFGLGELDSGV